MLGGSENATKPSISKPSGNANSPAAKPARRRQDHFVARFGDAARWGLCCTM